MNRKSILFAGIVILLAILALTQANAPAANAAPTIFASPIHAGCYLARLNQCKIHVEPFTINIATGSKLKNFSLVAIRLPGNVQTRIYDWRPDQSNPAPASGTTYTPSRVARDFAAGCGQSYEISLQGQDTLDSAALNLGLTGPFTCPAATYLEYVPRIRK